MAETRGNAAILARGPEFCRLVSGPPACAARSRSRPAARRGGRRRDAKAALGGSAPIRTGQPGWPHRAAAGGNATTEIRSAGRGAALTHEPGRGRQAGLLRQGAALFRGICFGLAYASSVGQGRTEIASSVPRDGEAVPRGSAACVASASQRRADSLPARADRTRIAAGSPPRPAPDRALQSGRGLSALQWKRYIRLRAAQGTAVPAGKEPDSVRNEAYGRTDTD